MGQVVALRKRNIRQEVIAELEHQLALAKCGELVGWTGMTQMASGKQVMYAVGCFADDPEEAANAAAKGLDLFCEQMGLLKKPRYSSPQHVLDRLPRRLRRG